MSGIVPTLSEPFQMSDGFGKNVACLRRTEQACWRTGLNLEKHLLGSYHTWERKVKRTLGGGTLKRSTSNAKISLCSWRQPWKLAASNQTFSRRQLSPNQNRIMSATWLCCGVFIVSATSPEDTHSKLVIDRLYDAHWPVHLIYTSEQRWRPSKFHRRSTVDLGSINVQEAL